MEQSRTMATPAAPKTGQGGTSLPKRALGWALRWKVLLRGLGLALPIAATVLLILAWKEGNAGAAPHLKTVGIESANARTGTHDCKPSTRKPREGEPPYGVPIAHIVIHSYEMITSTVVLDEELCVPIKTLSHLVNQHDQPMTERRGGRTEVTPAYLHSRTPVQLGLELISESSGEKAPMHDLTLAKMLGEHGQFVKTGSVTIPVSGAFATYPFDSYSTTELVVLRVKHGGVGHPGGAGVAQRPTTVLSLRVRPYVGDDVAPFGVETSAGHPRPAALDQRLHKRGLLLGIQLERKTKTQLYLILIALIPLVLALMLLIPIKRRSEPLDIAALAGFAAVLLAILPIRQVLVPASAPELSLADYWLGVEMAILACIGLFAVSRTM